MNKRTNKRRTDVIVIGGGAAGLMAAITAARNGAKTLILDHHPVSGKKILTTGNGKCNFTNQEQGISCYRSDDPAFVMDALQKFDQNAVIAFFRELGVYSKERNGYYYPRSGQASTIRETLLLEVNRLGIKLQNEVGIQKIQKKDRDFLIQTKAGTYGADCCIIATGGKTAPKTGSDGSGFCYALDLGHHVIQPLPALVPLVSGERWLKDTAGVRCDAAVSLFCDGELLASDSGELQMTDYGISGIPVFQVSRFASVALAEHKKVRASLDFLPEMSKEELKNDLYWYAKHQGAHKNWYHIICGFCNNKIAAMICKKMKLSEDPILNLSEKTLIKQLGWIVSQLKQTELTITGTRHMDQAQVTCGGVPLSEITENMESKYVSGLYFAGEILNVDGICGGYNLQWAWTSGYLAGLSGALQIQRHS